VTRQEIKVENFSDLDANFFLADTIKLKPDDGAPS